jgi:hypothetical protein
MFLSSKNYHQRGETIMSQGVLPFKYEAEKKTTGMTALAGSFRGHPIFPLSREK